MKPTLLFLQTKLSAYSSRTPLGNHISPDSGSSSHLRLRRQPCSGDHQKSPCGGHLHLSSTRARDGGAAKHNAAQSSPELPSSVVQQPYSWRRARLVGEVRHGHQRSSGAAGSYQTRKKKLDFPVNRDCRPKGDPGLRSYGGPCPARAGSAARARREQLQLRRPR